MGRALPVPRRERLRRHAEGAQRRLVRVPTGPRARWDPRREHRGRASFGERRVPALAEPGRDPRRGDGPRLRTAPVHPLEETDEPPERVPRVGLPSPECVRHPRLRVHPPLPEGEAAPIPGPRREPSREPVLPRGAGPLVQPGLDRRPRGPAGLAAGPKRRLSLRGRRTSRAHVLRRGRYGARPVLGDRHDPLGGGPLGAQRDRGRVRPRRLPGSRDERSGQGLQASGPDDEASGGSGGGSARWASSSSTASLR